MVVLRTRISAVALTAKGQGAESPRSTVGVCGAVCRRVQYVFDRVRVLVNNGQKDTRRDLRLSAPLFPVPDRCRRESEPQCEFTLAKVEFPPEPLYIDFGNLNGGFPDRHTFTTYPSNRLVEPGNDALCGSPSLVFVRHLPTLAFLASRWYSMYFFTSSFTRCFSSFLSAWLRLSFTFFG